MRNLKKDLLDARKEGFRFHIYVGTYRRRRYISEISGVRRTKQTLAGFTFGSDQFRQSQLRKIEQTLKDLKIRVVEKK